MPLVVKDRVRETSTTAGTGTFTLAGAVLGYQSFSAIGNGNTTYYTIYLQGGNEWEVGIGTYTASGTTLSRDTILASSNGGSAVNFSAGVKDVFVTYPAGRSVYYDTATNVTLNALTLSGGTANGVLYLNGSKVATSGSALTFDGANFGVGAAWTTNPMRSTQPQYFQYGTASTANVIAADGVALFQAMRFSSNSAGAFLILSKGRGTYASPTAVASGDNIGSLDFRVYGGTNSRAVAQINGVVDTYTSDADISSYLSFAVSSSGAAASTEQMRLVAGGKLNIGGNFTSTNNTLQVTGNAAIGYTAAAPSNGLIVAGNVGIGTDSPAYRLDVAGNARVTNSNPRIDWKNSARVYYWQVVDADNRFRIVDETAAAERVALDSSGNLGLGVTPSAWISNRRALEIGGKAANILGFPDIGQLYYNLYLNSSAEFVYKTTGYAGTFDYNYAVPGGFAWNLAASGTANTTTVTSGKNYTIVSAGGTNYTSFGAANNNVGTSFIATSSGTGNGGSVSEIVAYTQAMTLNSSGNLGLGVTSPARRLDVLSATAVPMRVGTTDSNMAIEYVSTLGTRYNWLAGAQYNINGGFEITPSTAAGNTTFTSPALIIEGASKNVGIGTTSANARLEVQASIGEIARLTTAAGYRLHLYANASGNAGSGIQAQNSDLRLSAFDPSTNIRFFTGDGSTETERARIDSAGTVFMRDGTSTTNTNSSRLVVGGTISETVGGVQYLVASQADIGTAPNEIPLNQYLGNLAYQDAGSIAGQVGLSAGTAALPSLVSATDTDTGMWFPAANTLAWSTGGTERVRIDSSGNLGLGVTPSVWISTSKALQVGSVGTIENYNNTNFNIGTNYYRNTSGTLVYTTSSRSVAYSQDISNGSHQWYNAASGTAGDAITFTQAMTLDASGNLLVGITSASFASGGGINVKNSSTSNVRIISGSSTGFDLSQDTSGNAYVYNRDNGFTTFATNNTERARITSGGYFKASNNGTYNNSGGNFHELYQSTNNVGLYLTCASTGQTESALFLNLARNTTNNTHYPINYYNSGAAASKFLVADSGNVTNTNGSYGTISDAKMKTDIVDAGSQWSDIKAIRFRKFKMKDDPEQIVQLGVVAQEVEQVSPGLVEEHIDRDAEGSDLGTTTKSVKTSVLLMKAAVALQEAMARIEQLEAKVSALENKGT